MGDVKSRQSARNRWATVWRPARSDVRSLVVPVHLISPALRPQVELFIEILTEEAARTTPPRNILPPPPEPFELRLIVWGAKGVIFLDGVCRSRGAAEHFWRVKAPMEHGTHAKNTP